MTNEQLAGYILEFINIMAVSEGMADCADSPLMQLRAKITQQAHDDLVKAEVAEGLYDRRQGGGKS